MRWVMGANSAKAMRGTGMDDVIFAGASARPPRNHAEVQLTIDNAQRRAPQPFTDSAIIEVSRRIDRGQGSTYRINGKEVRARDVQLLFADASTGANSPALVRQGQISELIAAKPQNRRRILEEAGGVAGLHTRRHEAELRLKAAEANLERLDDIGRELETALTRLKREARQAEKYKKISAEIRALQSALLFVRWNDARLAAEAAASELSAADRAVAEATSEAAKAQTAALSAQEGLKPAREEDAVAAALLHRASLERDRLDMAEQQARAEVDRLTAEAQRIANDTEREIAMSGDAEAELARLAAELEVLTAEIAAAPAARAGAGAGAGGGRRGSPGGGRRGRTAGGLAGGGRGAGQCRDGAETRRRGAGDAGGGGSGRGEAGARGAGAAGDAGTGGGARGAGDGDGGAGRGASGRRDGRGQRAATGPGPSRRRGRRRGRPRIGWGGCRPRRGGWRRCWSRGGGIIRRRWIRSGRTRDMRRLWRRRWATIWTRRWMRRRRPTGAGRTCPRRRGRPGSSRWAACDGAGGSGGTAGPVRCGGEGGGGAAGQVAAGRGAAGDAGGRPLSLGRVRQPGRRAEAGGGATGPARRDWPSWKPRSMRASRRWKPRKPR